jgi:ribosomal protein L32
MFSMSRLSPDPGLRYADSEKKTSHKLAQHQAATATFPNHNGSSEVLMQHTACFKQGVQQRKPHMEMEIKV